MYVCGIQTYVCMCVCTLKIRVYIYICIVKIYITIYVYIRNLANSNYIGYTSIYYTNYIHLSLNVDKHLMSWKQLRQNRSIHCENRPWNYLRYFGDWPRWWREIRHWRAPVVVGSEDWRSQSFYGFINISGCQRTINRTPGCIAFFRTPVWNSTFSNIPFVCIHLSYGTFFPFTLDPVTKMLGLPASASHDGTTPLARDSLAKFWVHLSVTNPGVGSLLTMNYWLFNRDHFNGWL